MINLQARGGAFESGTAPLWILMDLVCTEWHVDYEKHYAQISSQCDFAARRRRAGGARPPRGPTITRERRPARRRLSALEQ